MFREVLMNFSKDWILQNKLRVNQLHCQVLVLLLVYQLQEELFLLGAVQISQ